MKCTFVFSLLLIGVAAAAPVEGAAQTGAPRASRVARTAAARPAPAAVDVASVFVVSTGAERWAIDDPMPAKQVTFAGTPVSLGEREVGVSSGTEGGFQLLFPVSWYSGYQDKNPALKYVVVRYRDGRAFMILAEYNANRVAMPREKFQRHPDGKTWYADLEVVRQNGQVYTKQALSQGADDGNGGVWVDSIVLTCRPER